MPVLCDGMNQAAHLHDLKGHHENKVGAGDELRRRKQLLAENEQKTPRNELNSDPRNVFFTLKELKLAEYSV